MRKIVFLFSLIFLCTLALPVNAFDGNVKIYFITTYNGERVSVPYALINSNYSLTFEKTNINGEGYLKIPYNETVKVLFFTEIPTIVEFKLGAKVEYAFWVNLSSAPIDLPIKPKIFFSPLKLINLTYGEKYYDKELQEYRIPLTPFEYKFYKALGRNDIISISEVYNPLAWGDTEGLSLEEFKYYNSIIWEIWK